jgi:hypothetical protein
MRVAYFAGYWYIDDTVVVVDEEDIFRFEVRVDEAKVV